MAVAIEQLLATCKVLPVIVIENEQDAVPLAESLYAAGMSVLEVTLRTSAALAAVAAIRNALPDCVVGAGTVLSPENVEAAVNAGAQFMVSPGSTASLLDAAARYPSVPLLPGVATVSEAMAVYARGYSLMKFFPAEAAGGVAMLKALNGPLPQLRFCPTGGISAANFTEYLALPNVLCVGGSWMLNPEYIRNKNWEAIKQEAASVLA
jgi:2-dehydro-3-deoxyphosphogluconate aldolase/(4S)-4-hydroxy-2-oxoglutarate aldolase